MVIDCDSCEVRGRACGECVVGVLLGVPGVPPRATSDPAASDSAARPSGAPALQLDAPEQRALAVLADQGLVPRLRLVAGPPKPLPRNDHDGGAARDAG